MNVNFNYNEAEAPEKIVFEQIFAEKPGGGVVANPTYDIAPGTAIGEDGEGKLQPIKGFKLYAAVASSDESIKIEKGSGIVTGDAIGHAKKAVVCTGVDTSNAEYDVVTVSLGANIAKGVVLFQATGASASAASVKYAPKFVVGAYVYAGKGDQLVKLVNGANLRKETAPIASEVAALLPTINLV